MCVYVCVVAVCFGFLRSLENCLRLQSRASAVDYTMDATVDEYRVLLEARIAARVLSAQGAADSSGDSDALSLGNTFDTHHADSFADRFHCVTATDCVRREDLRSIATRLHVAPSPDRRHYLFIGVTRYLHALTAQLALAAGGREQFDCELLAFDPAIRSSHLLHIDTIVNHRLHIGFVGRIDRTVVDRDTYPMSTNRSRATEPYFDFGIHTSLFVRFSPRTRQCGAFSREFTTPLLMPRFVPCRFLPSCVPIGMTQFLSTCVRRRALARSRTKACCGFLNYSRNLVSTMTHQWLCGVHPTSTLRATTLCSRRLLTALCGHRTWRLQHCVTGHDG